MAESGPFGGAPHDAGGGSGWSEPSSDVSHWLRQWRARLPADDTGMPEDEARLVVEAVLEDLRGGQPDNLDRAGRAWGRAHRSVSEMVGRLSTFREALAASGVDDPLRMHRALDRVTAAATEEVLHRLEHASRTDALTGVGNRRSFDETLQAALSAATRQGHEVTVVAVDLDGLKRINDTDGHAAGDAALLSLVRSLYAALRDEDTVFRVGGDEFVILLPFTSVGAAEMLMERIHASGAPSFTWGAAGFPADAADAAALVEAADHDLYRRRQTRRSERRPTPIRRAVTAPVRSVSGAPVLRWAWIPAAAVLVMSLVATLVAAGPEVFSAKGGPHHSTTTTVPGGGSTLPGTGSGPLPLFAGSGGSFPGGGFSGQGASGEGNAVTTGYSAPGQSSGTPSQPTSPPPTTTPTTTPPSGSSGVLGLVGSVVAPVPVVGPLGQGLVTLVSQVLVGAPPAPPVTAAPAAITSQAASSRPAAGSVATESGLVPLLAALGNLLH